MVTLKNDVAKKHNSTDVLNDLNEITKYQIDEINKVKEYFNAEINERKAIVKKLVKI